MTPRPTYSAYQGAWRHDATGKRFTVEYATRAIAVKNRKADKQPKLAGWYWRAGGRISRRFDSSRAAWRDARETLAKTVAK